MDLFMQLSNTLCSFFHATFTASFVCLLCRTFQLKCKSRMLAPWQMQSSFEGYFKELGENQVRHRLTEKKRYKNDTSPEVSFLGMFHTLCAGHAYAKNHCCILHRRGRTRFHLLHGEKKRCSHCDCDVGGGKQEPAKRCRRCGERTGVRASRDVSKQRLSKKPIFPF